MRISDWSSDVCSSDLQNVAAAAADKRVAEVAADDVNGLVAAGDESLSVGGLAEIDQRPTVQRGDRIAQYSLRRGRRGSRKDRALYRRGGEFGLGGRVQGRGQGDERTAVEAHGGADTRRSSACGVQGHTVFNTRDMFA